MNALVMLLFVAVFVSGYLAQQLRVIPPYGVLVAEALTAVALLIVLTRLTAGKKLMLDWRYGVFLALLAFVLLIGFVAQSTPLGAVVAGLRNYVKYLPFFLLPAIYPFTGRQIRAQLVVVMALLFAQVPLAVYQRFVQFGDQMHTGDPVRGMATTSSALTLLMMGGVALIVSLYLRRRLTFPTMLVGVGALTLPTMLNETKSTLIMLPVAVLGPALFAPAGARALRKMLPLLGVGAVALLAYTTVYNTLIRHRSSGQELSAFFTEGHLESYLYSGAAEGDANWVGRFDSVAFAIRGIASDPLTMAFGLGAGNVSNSNLPGFEGRYAAYVELYGVDVTQVSAFLWEIGYVGLFTYLLFYWFAFHDARWLAKRDSPSSVRGQVWATVIVIMTLAMMYKSVFAMNEISYLFWFYSGLIAREAYAQRREAVGLRAALRPDRPIVQYGRRPVTGFHVPAP